MDNSGYPEPMYRAQRLSPSGAPSLKARIAVLLIGTALVGMNARAEFLQIEVFIPDMNCQPCSETLEASLQRMRGVAKSEVDFQAAKVRLNLANANRIGVEQVWDAIKRVGFTPGETHVTVRGTVKAS